ncbi:MAG: hypothetical protein QXH81_09130 [Thermofilaceae archaeon]
MPACPFCGSEGVRLEGRGRYRFFCENCGRTFYACTCGATFATPQAIASHMRTHHRPRRPGLEELNELKRGLEALEERVAELERRLGALEERVRALEGRAGGRQAGLDWLAGNPWLQLISARERGGDERGAGE